MEPDQPDDLTVDKTPGSIQISSSYSVADGGQGTVEYTLIADGSPVASTTGDVVANDGTSQATLNYDLQPGVDYSVTATAVTSDDGVSSDPMPPQRITGDNWEECLGAELCEVSDAQLLAQGFDPSTFPDDTEGTLLVPDDWVQIPLELIPRT